MKSSWHAHEMFFEKLVCIFVSYFVHHLNALKDIGIKYGYQYVNTNHATIPWISRI